MSFQPTRVIALAITVMLAVGVAGCSTDGPTRSVANFCSTYNSEKSKFQTRYAGVGKGSANDFGSVMQNLALGLQSLGDVSVILNKLDRVAPDDIEPDVAAVRDSWKSMQDTMGDEASNALNPTGMVGAMFRGLLLSAESNGSWTRVGNYVEQNCAK